MAARIALLPLGCVFAAPAQAQPLDVAPEETYVRAAPIERPAPSYPQQAAFERREGWVVLSYVVSTGGEVTDVMIEDSSGRDDFEREAVRAAQRWRYKPAMRNGEPVEQSMTRIRVQFVMEDSPTGASRAFVWKFREIQTLIDDGELNEAEGLLTDLRYQERRNLYEDAWFWWLRSAYLEATGEAAPHEIAASLQKAIGYEEDYLPPDLFVAAAQRLYVLQLRALDISGARNTFERLQHSEAAKRSDYYEQVISELTPSFAELDEIISGDRPLQLRARVGEHGYWVHVLLRRSFSLANIQGELELIDIRCDRGTNQYTAVSEELAWEIPESWGECGVYIKGREGATFDFYEYPSEG